MTPFPPRRHRRPRADGGFVLLEAIVSIALITILMVALTALFVSAMKVTNHQRLNQGAVRLATAAIDTARGLGPKNLPDGDAVQTVGGIEYTVKSSQEVCALDSAGACVDPTNPDVDPADQTCAADDDCPFVRYLVTISWDGAECGSSPCTYKTSLVLSAAEDPVFVSG
jgi:type II secretory pathway pseudopilin PulG